MSDSSPHPASNPAVAASRDARLLVVYASRHGSTKGIAERIAARLAERRVPVELLSVDQVDDLTPYGSVVFGSPVYDQRWTTEAERFVGANTGALAERPVWLFSVGTFGDDKRLIGPLMRREPKGVGEITDAIRPRDYRVFAGVIERQQWPFASRLLYHALGGRLGDNRDWAAIDAWAEQIADELPTEADR